MSRPLPLTFRRAFRTVEGGTRVTFRYDAHPGVDLKLVEPLVVLMGKRQLDGDILDRVFLDRQPAVSREALGDALADAEERGRELDLETALALASRLQQR